MQLCRNLFHRSYQPIPRAHDNGEEFSIVRQPIESTIEETIPQNKIVCEGTSGGSDSRSGVSYVEDRSKSIIEQKAHMLYTKVL